MSEESDSPKKSPAEPDPKKRKSRRPRKTKLGAGGGAPKRAASATSGAGASKAQGGDETETTANHLRWTVTIVLVIVAFAATLLFVVYPERRGPGSGRDVELSMVGDESPDALAARLATAGLIRYPTFFAIYVRARGDSGKVAPGPHLLLDDLTPRELLARLSQRGGGQKTKVVIPEGFTRLDIGKRLQTAHVCSRRLFVDATADKALLGSLRIDGDTAEGFLFPATYEFAQDSLPEEVVRKMKLEFDRRYAALEEKHGAGINDLQESLQWGRREIVILASMIEKEAVVDDERPVIAGVFLNRLRDPKFSPKLLQSDPTAAYGCLIDPSLASCRTFTGKITHALLSDASNVYNTYKRTGLPPGPIANPGARSLEAVMAPASTRAFYFVAKGSGRHTFSETYEGHQSAIKGAKSPAPVPSADGDDAPAPP